MTTGKRFEIEEKIAAMFERDARVSRPTMVRASEIGHPCERYLALNLREWHLAKPPSATLMSIFQLGNIIEAEALSQMQRAGLIVTNQQRDFPKSKLGLASVHVDAFVAPADDPGAWCPIDVKSMNPAHWQQINTPQDILTHGSWFVRKYFAQIQVYAHESGASQGVLYLFNKVTGEGKSIWIEHDAKYCDGLRRKANRAKRWAARKDKRLPARVEYCAMCETCRLKDACMPSMDFTDEGEITDGPGRDLLVGLLKQRAKLVKQAAPLSKIKKACDVVNDMIRGLVEGKPQVVAGDYLITGKLSQRKGFEVNPSERWTFKVTDMKT